MSIYIVFVKTNCAAEQCHILALIRNQSCVTTPENISEMILNVSRSPVQSKFNTCRTVWTTDMLLGS